MDDREVKKTRRETTLIIIPSGKHGVSSVSSVLISLTQIRSSHPAYDPLRFSQLGLSRPKLKKRGHTSPSELLCL